MFSRGFFSPQTENMKISFAVGLLLSLLLSGNVWATVGHDDLQSLYIEQKYDAVISLANKQIEQKKANADTYYYKGLAEQMFFKFTDAMVSFELAMACDTTNLSVQLALAGSAEMAGNNPKAIAVYKKMIEKEASSTLAKARLAHIYKSQKEFGSAIELYSDLVKADSTNGYFYSQLAQCCSKFGLSEPAIDYYITATTLNPTDYESAKDLVNELLENKFYTEAHTYIDTFLVLFNGDLYFKKQNGLLYALEGFHLESVRTFSAIVAAGDSSQFTCKYYGQSLYNNGQYPEAVYWLDRYLKQAPDDTKNQFIMGLACQKDYQYEKSLYHLNTAYEQLYNPDLLARLSFETGNTQAAYGKYLAFRDSTKIKARDKFDLATQNYVKALEIKPQYPIVLLTLAQHYETNLHDLQMAVYYYEKYYKTLDPMNVEPYEIEWVEQKITRLKEEQHFKGK